jgi:hypothetical protein
MQPLPERIKIITVQCLRRRLQEPDAKDLPGLLLRTGNKRPRDGHSAEKRDELAPFHVLPREDHALCNA